MIKKCCEKLADERAQGLIEEVKGSIHAALEDIVFCPYCGKKIGKS